MSCLIGGMANDRPADSEVHEILGKIRGDVEEKLGKFPSFTAESYRTQVVNGVNYFIKVHTGDDDKRLHLRVYKPIRGEPEFVCHLPDRKKNDSISYF